MTACHRFYPFPSKFTRKELADRMGWDINRITGRVLSLLQRDPPFLLELSERRDGAALLQINNGSNVAPQVPLAKSTSATAFVNGMDKPGERGLTPASAAPRYEIISESLVHTYDRKGKPFSYVACTVRERGKR